MTNSSQAQPLRQARSAPELSYQIKLDVVDFEFSSWLSVLSVKNGWFERFEGSYTKRGILLRVVLDLIS
jgi:hypothetical protein